jgi:hypothetical protein
MGIIGTILSDPVFQFGIFVIVVGTIAVLLALRSQVGSHPVAVARGTRMVLTLGVLSVLLVSGWSGWHALPTQGQRGTVPLSSPSVSANSLSPSAGSLATQVQEPSPTPTPHLARSITQVLTAFCQAISARDYPAAWGLYATSLQHRHTYTAVAASWRHYTACRIPDQAYDPDAIALLTLTLAPGAKDQFGFTGDTDERFTMGIQAQAWRITAVCHIIAEGCYPLVWG